MSWLNPDDVMVAAERLQGRVRRTPVVTSNAFPGSLKLETLQLTGAYKVRGALNALMVQVSRGDRRPVIAASAGNHAAGVAWAGRALGLSVISVVPEAAPANKVARTQALGAQVLRHGQSFEEAFEEAQRLAKVHEWRFLHPFDDLDVMAGQGSVGVELLAERPDVVLVPIGGGGLASGVGTVLHDYGVRIIGVQIRGVDAMAQALGYAHRTRTSASTVADGIAVKEVGKRSAAICAEVLDDIIRVSEDEVRLAMRRLALEDHVISEGAGALAVAALDRVPGRKKVAVVSGGNVDPRDLMRVLAPSEPRSSTPYQEMRIFP